MRRLLGWVRLVHPFPSFLVAATAVAFAATAPGGLRGGQALRTFIMVLCSQLAVGAFNDYSDAELDALAKPEKPIPAGLVPRTAALTVAATSSLVTLVIAAGFGPPTLALGLLATSAGLVYDFPLKRTGLSWLPYVVGLPLLPLWAWSTVGHLPPSARWAYPIGVLLALALHIANALPDDAGDRRAGTRGLVQNLGRRRSLFLLVGSFAAAGALALSLVLPTATRDRWSAALASSGLMLGSLAIVLLHRVESKKTPFRLLAVASGLLAIGVARGTRSDALTPRGVR